MTNQSTQMADIKPGQEIKRQVAYKCTIAELKKGIFVKKEGWESNYIMTDYGDFSRVNIIAVITSKENNSITIDDGTASITARFFDGEKQLQDVDIGSLVLVIGRPREFNNQMYLTLEIVRKIEKGWIAYRKKELALYKKIRNVDDFRDSAPKQIEPEIVESATTLTSKDKLVNLITQLDDGSGANIDDIIKLSKIKNAEEFINDMMLKGEIFEIKPGRLKVM